jgi:hypothetical protein
MAGPSSFVPHAAYALGYPVTEKLARNNHPLWKAQVQSAIKGAQVGHFLDKDAQPPSKTIAVANKLDETTPNPEYEGLDHQGSTNTQLSAILAIPGHPDAGGVPFHRR